MNATLAAPLPTPAAPRPAGERYAKAVEASKRIRWDLDRDVLRGRSLDANRAFLPGALTRVRDLAFLTPREARFYARVQGRTYANLLAALERGIASSALALAHDRPDGDVAGEALRRMSDEALKHRTMFRRLDALAAAGMPDGYAFVAGAEAFADEMLGRSRWAALALTLHVEVAAQAHYRTSLDDDETLCEVWKDVLLQHWKEESPHTVLDELEWRREHARGDALARERGVDDLVALYGALDLRLRGQAHADAAYFIAHAGRMLLSAEEAAIRDAMLRAYRRQHVALGAQEPRFVEVLRALATPAQFARLGAALAPVLEHACG
jgi:hypothetical protein